MANKADCFYAHSRRWRLNDAVFSRRRDAEEVLVAIGFDPLDAMQYLDLLLHDAWLADKNDTSWASFQSLGAL